MFLVFDTETSGLRREGVDLLDPSQPRMIQIGAQLFDGKWVKRGGMLALIKPDGWSIEPEAQDVHGISEARAARYGIPLVSALGMFKALSEKAEFIIGHNLLFDRGVVTSELHRIGAAGLWWQRRMEAFRCTMEAATPILQLPGQFGFKYPTLEEAHHFLLPALDYHSQHDAEPDLEATARVYRELDARGAWPAIKHSSMIGR